MSAEFRKAKDRAEQAWQEAVNSGYANLADIVPMEYRIALWSNSVEDMYRAQWCIDAERENRGWDWHEVHRRYRSPKDRVAALITDDRLSALVKISATRQQVTVGIIEGDPRGDCPLKSQRALIMLDLAATYGQVLGCKEIHLEALNYDLMVLYRDTYGFCHAPTKGAPFAMKQGLV